MKTDDLIAALAVDLPPTSSRQLERRLLLTLVPAAAVALAGVVWWLGVRGDIYQAVTGVTFWAKAAYTGALAVAGFWLFDRLGRPGADVRPPVILLATIVGIVAMLAIFEQVGLPADARVNALMGASSSVCMTNILGLSALAAPAILWAARRFAPTRPALAGAAAGVLIASLAATLYGLHCPERTATFIGVWYTGAVIIAAGIGSVFGRFFLRW